jgi:hypothetical protein
MGAVYALKELVRSQELKHLRFFIFVTPFK